MTNPCQPELDGGRQRGQDISAKAAASVPQVQKEHTDNTEKRDFTMIEHRPCRYSA